MKKVLLSVFAIAALASCMQDDILGTAQGTAISFDNAYVDNATKAIDSSFNNNNLEVFQVYGTVTNTANEVANIFPGIAVVKGGTGVGAAWTYDAQYTQYWVANNYYNFTAIVAGNEAGETMVEVDTNGMPKAIKVEDAEAQNDVLFAQVGPVNYANNVQAVKFTFKHLLAKAKVSVRNIMDVNNGNYYVVKDVKITNAHKSATYTIGEGWGSYADAYVLPFGDIVAPDATAADAVAIQLPKDGYGVSTFERLLVPQQNCAFTISVDYVLYQSGVQIDTKEELTVSTNATIEAGKSYNFALTLGNPGEPITFDVEAVEDWKDGGVKDAADLKAAFENGGTIFLAEDVILDEQLVVPAGKRVVLNLNGHTISQEKACTASYEMIANNGELTIMGNGKISFKDTGAGDPNFGWGSYTIRNSGTLVVEDGVIEHLGEQAFATHMICAIYQYSGSTTINGGVISTPNYRSARLWKGEMIINGGKFNGQLWVQAVDNSSELTVNGGNFAPVGGDGSSIFVTNSQYTVNLAVNGGYFNTKIGTSVPSKDGVKGAIKGGSFTESAKENTNADLLAEGYGFVENGPALWNVEKLPINVSTDAELTTALSLGGNIVLQNDIDIAKIDLTNLTEDVVIDANGKTITTASNYGVQVAAGKNITLKNATVEITVEGNYITYAAGLKIENGDYQGNTITLKDCEIKMANTDWAYAVNMPASVKNLNLVIDGCTLEGAIALQCWGDNNTITVTDSNLICNYTTSSLYTSYCVALQGDGTYNAENNVLDIRGCNFSYSGVDNYDSVIKAVVDRSGTGSNTITVVDCTCDSKVTL